MKRFAYTSFTMAVLFWGLTMTLANGSESPRLGISETTFDFKEAFEGEKVSHDFVVRNSGKAALHIKEVRRT